MRDLISDGECARTLLWISVISATSDSFRPESLTGWHRVDLAGQAAVIPASVPPSARFSVIFEATCNSALNYDPVIHARAVRSHFNRAPDALVALVAPSLEVPVATQHAIAYEVGKALGDSRVDVVTTAERWSPQSARKIIKAEADGGRQANTALDEALEIVAGRKRGNQVDREAATFAYAYTTDVRRRDPFRCTRLQREILHEVAVGGIKPTTAAIAGALRVGQNKVNDSIVELVDALVPRAAGERERRDSHERLYWLIHHYGVWIRLVEGREIGGTTPRGRGHRGEKLSA